MFSPARRVHDRATMDLSLDATDKELVLDLLRTLRGTAAAAPAVPRAAATARVFGSPLMLSTGLEGGTLAQACT